MESTFKVQTGTHLLYGKVMPRQSRNAQLMS